MLFGVMIGAGALVSASAADNPSGRAANPESVTLNFVNADIDGVVKAMSEITGKSFVLDPRVKGTVNIVSARPMSRTLVYEVFLSALRLQGYAATEDRGVVKIIPESDAKVQASPTLGPQDKSPGRGDQIQTRVFALKYESAAQLVQVLRPLISSNNTIAAHPNNNTLVITDYAGNLDRVEKILEAVDQPGGNEPILIPLRYASALDVAQTVNRLFGEGAGTAGADASQRITVAADTRSNSILARSENPSRLTRLRSLVAMLDTPTSAAGNIHVVYLKNAEAVKVAETLRAIFNGESSSGEARLPAPQGGVGASASAGASPASTPLGSSASQATAGSGIVQADPATNSVIITAPDVIYNNLRAVVEKLDARRAQVYVEALIAEVSADKTAEFGIQWQSLRAASGSDSAARAFGGTNFGSKTGGQNILGVAANPTTIGGGINIGVVKGTVTVPGISTPILNLGLLARALATDDTTNILSTPTLLTLDNEEARIVVGQNVPFITGQYTTLSGATSTPTPFQTVERKDVGLALRIKPQISEGGVVRLQIYQEVSSVDTTASNVAGIITNKRSIETTVLVDDGQIVVIGGLMQDAVKDGNQKAPLLGDLPLIGGLFQYKTRSRNKTNLMVFLRPVVMRDGDRINPVTAERYDYIRGEQQKVKPESSLVLPDVDSPTLPPRVPVAPDPVRTPQADR